jgi:hypothetical protein
MSDFGSVGGGRSGNALLQTAAYHPGEASGNLASDDHSASRARGQRAILSGNFHIPLSGGAAARHDSLSGMQPDFRSRLAAMFHDAPAGSSVFSGYRSPALQAMLFNRPHRPGFVARPGHSHHGFGDAADLRGNLGWFHKHAHEYGLRFPMSYEPWHIQGAGKRPHGFHNMSGQVGDIHGVPSDWLSDDSRVRSKSLFFRELQRRIFGHPHREPAVPPPRGGTQFTLHIQSRMDGRLVGKHVERHIVKSHSFTHGTADHDGCAGIPAVDSASNMG